jgi:hypothetical protein
MSIFSHLFRGTTGLKSFFDEHSALLTNGDQLRKWTMLPNQTTRGIHADETELAQETEVAEAVPAASATVPASLDVLYASEFVSDYNYPDGTIVGPGHLMKQWEVRNSGPVIWPKGTEVQDANVSSDL